MRTMTTMAILALSLPVHAQEGPSFDCARAESSAEKLVCADAGLARLDRLVSERFGAAVAAARALDAGAHEAEDLLRAYQRGWIGGRDECWKAEDPAACVELAYLEREGQLVAGWMLDAPVATEFWTCDGSPANEVVVSYFDTTLPSVRFERGDDVDTGRLSPTASGTRYEGSFGRFIWTKGDTATYRDPDPDGREVACTLTARR